MSDPLYSNMKMLGTLRKEHVMNVDKSVTLNRIVPSSRGRRKSHLQTKGGAKERKLMLHGRVVALHLIHHQALAQVMKTKWPMYVSHLIITRRRTKLPKRKSALII
ncbi:hypothetical protein QL285_008826 [Trifolium repens]|nr:hypothetical protein QL285_008826 [Trifolium repens]